MNEPGHTEISTCTDRQAESGGDGDGELGSSTSSCLTGVSDAVKSVHGQDVIATIQSGDHSTTLHSNLSATVDSTCDEVASQGDGSPGDSLGGDKQITADDAIVEHVSTLGADVSSGVQSGDDNPTIHTSCDSSCDIEASLQEVGPVGDSSGGDNNRMMEDSAVVKDASTLCADISSAVSHMDIDVSEESKETSDSTAGSGIAVHC